MTHACAPLAQTALTADVVTVFRRIKLLGFNAIRLPFSFDVRSIPPDRMAQAAACVRGEEE